MTCVIGSSNVKIFGKAFHSLVRIADDLYIEALPSGLVFHTVNASKSAYARFTFKPDFFISYREDSSEKRKVLLKSCLMPFRSIQTMEKNVEKCLFDLTSMVDYLLLKFFCKHGVIKIYHLHFVDNETVQGSFPNSGFLCKLGASSRLLQDGIQNFSNSVEELTLTVCSDKILLKNYVDDEPDPNKVVHTELTLESQEFEQFEVDKETKITFCLKELKAILSFSEGFNVPVLIQCQSGGKPVTFNINGLRGVDVQFVLATLADRDTQCTPLSGSVLRTSVAHTSQRKDSVAIHVTKSIDSLQDSNANSRNNADVNGTPSVSTTSNTKTYGRIVPALCLSDDEEESLLGMVQEDKLCEDLNDDIVPGSPPRKKFRSMFLGLSQSTCTSMAPDPDEVLVANSDDEGS